MTFQLHQKNLTRSWKYVLNNCQHWYDWRLIFDHKGGKKYSLQPNFGITVIVITNFDNVSLVSWIWISLTWLRWFGFRHEPIPGNNEAARKCFVLSKSSRKLLKNNNRSTFMKLKSKFLQHSVSIFLWHLCQRLASEYMQIELL